MKSIIIQNGSIVESNDSLNKLISKLNAENPIKRVKVLDNYRFLIIKDKSDSMRNMIITGTDEHDKAINLTDNEIDYLKSILKIHNKKVYFILK